MRTVALGEIHRRRQSFEVDDLGNLCRQGARPRSVKRQLQREEHVLQSHHPQTDGPPAVVRRRGGGDRIERQIDDPIELTNGNAHGGAQLVEVEAGAAVAGFDDVASEVYRAQVADGGFVAARDLEDLGAQVREVHHAARQTGLVARLVRLVFEGHPTIAGLRERAHHPRIEIASRCGLVGETLAFGIFVGAVEIGAKKVGQGRHHLWIKQAPEAVAFDAAHEEVGHPVGEVEIVRAAGVVAGVVAQLKEAFDVGVPRLEVHATCTFALATLVHRRDGSIEGFQPRDDAVAVAIGAGDQRTTRPHAVPGDADAA